MSWENPHRDTRISVEKEEVPPTEGGPDTQLSVPDESWTKAEIVGWLNSQGVEASADQTKAELLDKVSEV